MSISLSASVTNSNRAIVADRPNVASQPFPFRFCYVSVGFEPVYFRARASGFGFWVLEGFSVARVFCRHVLAAELVFLP